VRPKVKQTMYLLSDEQIEVSRPAVVADGPHVATQMRGGTCNTQSQCEEAGGKWVPDPAGNAYCMGAGCKDSGTGDWD